MECKPHLILFKLLLLRALIIIIIIIIIIILLFIIALYSNRIAGAPARAQISVQRCAERFFVRRVAVPPIAAHVPKQWRKEAGRKVWIHWWVTAHDYACKILIGKCLRALLFCKKRAEPAVVKDYTRQTHPDAHAYPSCTLVPKVGLVVHDFVVAQ